MGKKKDIIIIKNDWKSNYKYQDKLRKILRKGFVKKVFDDNRGTSVKYKTFDEDAVVYNILILFKLLEQ